MKPARVLAAAALCVAVALTIARDGVARFRCDAEKKRTELWLETASQTESLERQMAIARGAIPRLVQCAESDPSDYDALYLLGVARRMAGQNEASVRAFSASLALNERPETYTNIGVLQLEEGQAEEARRNLRRAVYFNLDMIDNVDHALRAELEAAVEARRARLAARAR